MFLQAEPFVIVFFVAGAILAFFAVLSLWGKLSSDSSLDWLEAVFASAMLVVVFVGWISVVLASFGWFSLEVVSGVLLVTAVFILWWQHEFTRPTFAKPKWQDILLLILLIGSAIVYFRPHEYVLGGNDAGGYINIGSTIANTGEFIIQNDEWTRWLSQFPEVTLRDQPPHWRTDYLQFVGWYIDDNNPARVIPQFFPFHPTLLAVAIRIGGIGGGLLLTPLWSVLSLLALYLLTRRLFDRNVAFLASALLAITAVTIYFSRYPTTEPLTLLLIFTGLLCWQILWENPKASIVWGILGGAAFGTSFLTRIDLPLVALLVYGWLILVWLQGKWNRSWLVFTLTLSFLALHAIISAVVLNWPYMWNTYGSLVAVFRQYPWLSLVVGAGGAAGLGVIFFIWRRGWEAFAQSRLVHILQSAWFRWLLIIGVIGLSAFAYFVRPLLNPPRSYISWPGGTTAWNLDGQNWVRMGWYTTPLGILFTTLGLGWILRWESLNRLGLFLSVTVLTTFQYVFKIFNTPYHIYTMRRYMPIVLPALMIFAAYFLVSLYLTPYKRQWVTRLAAVILTLALAAGLLYQSRFVLPLRENRGITAQLHDIANELEPEAVLLIIEPGTSLFADTFGAPLRFIYGHDIATIRSDDQQAEQFLDALFKYVQEGKRPLQLLAVEPIPANLEDQLNLEAHTFIPITLHRLQSTFFDYPSQMETAYYGVEIYNVGLPGAANKTPDNLMVDIGTLDAPYIQSGFYYKEPLPGPTTMRWTDGLPTVEVPTAPNSNIEIAVQAKIFRPETVTPSVVTVLLDNEPVGTFTPTDSWQTYTFSGQPNPTDGESLIQFATDTFNPAELGISGDARNLGFLIDWITIVPKP